eukprot:CAMPEP_0206005070 /NCGR_PEP_ID=MMETSP1464-20131121/4352_1 /ASSEMBLY_ACC=CAM_ASM_001124 /TAXON_ID=119497 /ORGANISM="Exanthemachrysis gayraliae, Strain RCC1523" /LENGTH=272 /DNA_ID=CAMNT_0053378493 /DNA_START=361 /DNA_END=1175 /DNA_ORIENTATION=-
MSGAPRVAHRRALAREAVMCRDGPAPARAAPRRRPAAVVAYLASQADCAAVGRALGGRHHLVHGHGVADLRLAEGVLHGPALADHVEAARDEALALEVAVRALGELHVLREPRAHEGVERHPGLPQEARDGLPVHLAAPHGFEETEALVHQDLRRPVAVGELLDLVADVLLDDAHEAAAELRVALVHAVRLGPAQGSPGPAEHKRAHGPGLPEVIRDDGGARVGAQGLELEAARWRLSDAGRFDEAHEGDAVPQGPADRPYGAEKKSGQSRG